MNVEMLFGSAVVAATLSGFVTYMISKRQGNLQYITAERREWRAEIREIASKINGVEYEETLQLLVELKVRINAFGNKGVLLSYSSDAHIWDLINEIEKEQPERNALKMKQKQLIEYISLLLKYDWERCKKEVKGDVCNTISFLLVLLSELFFVISMFFLQTEGLEVFHLISVSVEFVLMMMLLYFFQKIEAKSICKTFLNGVNLIESKQYKTIRLYISYIVWGISIILMIIFYMFFVKDFLAIVSCGDNNTLVILITSIIYCCGLILMGWVEVTNADNIYYYNKTIYEIKQFYK